MFFFTNFFTFKCTHIMTLQFKKEKKKFWNKKNLNSNIHSAIPPTRPDITSLFVWKFTLWGPSTVIVIRSFKILLERRLRRSVLIRDSAENPLSQSTVDTGKTRPIAANLVRFGNIAWISIVLKMWVMSSRGSSCLSWLLAAITLLKTFNSDLASSHCEDHSGQWALVAHFGCDYHVTPTLLECC